MSDKLPAIVALVPLRGGSKSIPLKNIKTIAGKPLCLWVLEAAVQSGLFRRVVVSTDDDRIASVVSNHLPSVEVIRRPPELATDTASTESVMTHLAGHVPFDLLCTIQATSPLTSATDLRAAYELFHSSRADSLLTAVRLKRFLWTDTAEPMNYDPKRRPMRQEFQGTLMENGAFYFTTRKLLESTGCRLGGRIEIYEMNAEAAIELDEHDDWRTVENLLVQRACAPDRAAIRGLRHFFFDVDGTLTDGGMYYRESGEELKRFNTRDGLGIRKLTEAGIGVGLLSSEDSGIIRARAAKLGLAAVYVGAADKLSTMRKFSAEAGIPMSRIGFMGDDLNDVEALKGCGFSACPADAVPEVRAMVDYVCSASGGRGAVRELCDRVRRILESEQETHKG